MMKRMEGKLTHSAAFTLMEMLMVVTSIAVLAGSGLVMISGTIKTAKAKKLTGDVATINAALTIFLANGGDLEGANTAADIIERIKTRAEDSQEDQLVGIRAGLLDPRIKAVDQSTAESGSANPRVYWNPSKQRFVVKYIGAIGIKQFVLDKSKAGAPETAYERKLVVEFSKKGKDKWVWEYGNHETAGKIGPSNLPPGGTASSLPLSSAGATGLPLDPPDLSFPGDTYAIIDYDGLEVTLTNSNPPGVSEIFYSNVSGVWERYLAPIPIAPGTVLETQMVTLDPDNWSDSVTTLDEYLTTPVTLELAVAFTNSSYDYVGLGGALEPGSYPLPVPVNPGMVSLTNNAAIPSQFLNSGIFNILWTLDGSDPIAAQSPFAGTAFSGGFQGQQIPVSLDDWGPGDTLEVKAYAKSYQSAIVTDSDLVTETLTATTIQLRQPRIDIDPSTGVGTLSLETNFGDMPLGAWISYTTDGTDPGIAPDGGPLTGSLYTAPIPDAATVPLMARVYAPVIYSQWFLPSDASTEIPPIGGSATPVPSFPTNAILSQDTTSRLYSVEVDVATSQGSYSAISGPNSQGKQYNAIGYRAVDSMLYGMNPVTGRLLKVDMATGDATVVANLGITSAYAGDFNTDNGLYYIKRSVESKLYVIDVDAGSVVQQINLTPSVGGIGDLAYNSADGKFYSYDAKKLYVIDPTTGAVVTHPAHAENPSGHAGASFASGGNVFIALNSGGLYWLDTTDGRAHYIADSPSSSRNDGALIGSSPPDTWTEDNYFSYGLYSSTGKIVFESNDNIDVSGGIRAENNMIMITSIGNVTISGDLAASAMIKMESVNNATINGDLTSEMQIDVPSSITHNGTESVGSIGDMTLHALPAPTGASDPNYAQPITIINGDYTIDGSLALDGTIYATGNISVNSGVSLTGSGALVAGGSISINSVGSVGNSSDGVFFYSLNSSISVHSVDTVTVNGVFYAPSASGDIIFDSVGSATINGGIYSGADLIFDSINNLTVGPGLGFRNVVPPGIETILSSSEPPTTVLAETFEGASPGMWDNGFDGWGTGQNFSDSEHGQIPDGGSRYAALSSGPIQATVDFPGLLTASQQTAVAAGTGVWGFSAWLASWKNDNAVAEVSVEWFDGPAGTGTSLGTAVLADGSGATNVAAVINGTALENDAANWNADNWSKYVTSGTVPAGAQSFVMTYRVNSGVDGYADNLSFEISE